MWLAEDSHRGTEKLFCVVFLGGRVDERRSLAAVERYNPAVDEWEEVAPLSGPRRSVSVAAQNGRLYAIGGSGTIRWMKFLYQVFSYFTMLEFLVYRYK